MASVRQAKASKYAQIDKALFGGLLPGGTPLSQIGAAVETSPVTQQPVVGENKSAGAGGSFNAQNGGFTSDTGQFYPTNNPNFVPGATGLPNKNLDFSKPGKVVVNGKEMTSQEYQAQQQNAPYNQQVAQAEQAQQNQLLAGQVGNEQMLPSVQGSGLDYGQLASQAGVRGVLGGVAGAGTIAGIGAAIGAGAAGGTLAAPGVGTLIGAAGGLIAGVLSAVVSNVKSQRTGNIAAQNKVRTDGQVNLNKLIRLTKVTSDPQQRSEIIQAFNYQLSKIKRAQLDMQQQTRRDVLKFEDATPDLQAFEDFYAPGGARDYYTSAMQLALNGSIDLNELNAFLAENAPSGS